MALMTFKAKSQLKEGVQVEATTRQFKLLIDEPEELGGKDEGMNPVEAILCALGACQCIVARVMAEKLRIKLEDFWVEVEGDLDIEGFMGNEEIRPGYQALRCKFHIKADAPESKVQKLVDLIERFCPVGDTLENGTPLTAEYVIE